MKKLILAMTVVTLCSFGFGENLDSVSANNPTQATGAQKNVTQTGSQKPNIIIDHCAFTFTSGHAETFLKYCVTQNGNIIQLETPRGHEHLLFAAKGSVGEGYGMCDSSGTEYSDYAEFGDSGNWNPATVLAHDDRSVIIVRTTSDGIWTLTQTFTQVSGTSPSVRIAMRVTNNSDKERDVILFRYANVNADGFLRNNLDATHDSAFAWNSTDGRVDHPGGFGLMLQNVGVTPFKHFGFILNVPNPPEPCRAFVHATVGPITKTDGAIFVDYEIGLNKQESKTVTVAYKGL